MTQFRSLSMPAGFRRHVVGKLGEMFVTVVSFEYALLVN